MNIYKKKNAMKVIITFCFIIFFSNNILANKTDVVLTGFSINADYKDLERSAYYTNKLLNKYSGRQNIIDQTLKKEIRALCISMIKSYPSKSLKKGSYSS